MRWGRLSEGSSSAGRRSQSLRPAPVAARVSASRARPEGLLLAADEAAELDGAPLAACFPGASRGAGDDAAGRGATADGLVRAAPPPDAAAPAARARLARDAAEGGVHPSFRSCCAGPLALALGALSQVGPPYLAARASLRALTIIACFATATCTTECGRLPLGSSVLMYTASHTVLTAPGVAGGRGRTTQPPMGTSPRVCPAVTGAEVMLSGMDVDDAEMTSVPSGMPTSAASDPPQTFQWVSVTNSRGPTKTEGDL
mmetsp:Transcript_3278/g.13485  ORF Transcript_3278/g.13485 Transcript_3278/m.13485 type:complete len:258 (-) Transcript_3278:1169-1942(-)